MLLDEEALDEYTDRFTSDAFRHETLTRYDVSSDGDDFARWMAGEPVPDTLGPWGRWIQEQLARGAAVRRLRVLYAPPGDYLRFEMDHAYTRNVIAGEDIRVLDLTDRPRPAEMTDAEFWMLDGERAALMHYDDQGRFLHAETIEGRAARRIRRARDAAWDAGEQFDVWWARHPECHRARV